MNPGYAGPVRSIPSLVRDWRSARFKLHFAGLVCSVKDGCPGYVADEGPVAITAEIKLAAVEQCTSDVWRR